MKKGKEKFYWLNKESVDFLNKGYLKNSESPQERIRDIGNTAEHILKKMWKRKNGDKEIPFIIESFSDLFFKEMEEGNYSLSSPLWANLGREKGLPISCFSSYFEDSIEGILSANSEVGMMTKQGGGTSGYFGAIRHRGAPISGGSESEGAVHFMGLTETIANKCKQSGVRRGAFAAYLPVDHPDFYEFIKIRQEGHPLQDIFFGIILTDEFMESLSNPERTENIEKWCAILDARSKTGMPYLFWEGNVSKGAPQVYKDKNIKINNSNLCSEILLSSSQSESYVCCLSSLNLLNYDSFGENTVKILALLLDSVMEEFIEKTDGISFMDRARRFAINQRALGMGVLGWHSYLQENMIPFESFQAKMKNGEIFENIGKLADEANSEMAEMFGEPELLKGYGKRAVTMMAIAPTMSSSFILGQVSSGIEPLHSNGFEQELAKVKSVYKNPKLEEVLEEYGLNNKNIWKSIFLSNGSVQHLTEIPKEVRDVFLTFFEIGQREIIIQAAQRQKYIDQSQSLNLAIDTTQASPKEISELYIDAWKMGVKTAYYQKSISAAQDAAESMLTDLYQVVYVHNKFSSILKKLGFKNLARRLKDKVVVNKGRSSNAEKHKIKTKSLSDCSSCEG